LKVEKDNMKYKELLEFYEKVDDEEEEEDVNDKLLINKDGEYEYMYSDEEDN
jgi:hypothetical protein